MLNTVIHTTKQETYFSRNYKKKPLILQMRIRENLTPMNKSKNDRKAEVKNEQTEYKPPHTTIKNEKIILITS